MAEDADPAATRDADPAATRDVIPASSNTHAASDYGRLEVRCPNCHAPTKVAVDTALTDVTCSSCGSHFSLVDQSKATRMAPSLTRMGRFELIERLGVGGFGSVWKARDKELDRTVAIKIPRAGGMTSEEQDKFFREARAAAQLRHPNIVSVHEVGRDGDSVYIVSAFVRGVTLSDWLTAQQLTSHEAAELCAKIADALHHAHEQGVVHRDLKPANIIMDYDGEPHLMDFGLARREAGEVTMTMDGQVLGTPAYMSPEQAQGESHTADRRSDVYSLGVILFQLLTGELPFRGNARMLIKQVIHDDPPSPRKLNASIPKDLETITLKCLEKEPARRYQSAAAVANEFLRYIAGQPIQSRPVGGLERSWRWSKRNPRIALLTSTVGVLLITIAVVATVAAVRISVARNEADAKATEAEAERRNALASEERAKAEAKRATDEAEKAREVSKFLAQMFQKSAPFSVGGLRFGIPDINTSGASMTAREILDLGAQRVEEDLKEQPLVRAALNDTVGNVYLGLGMIEKAETLLERALALRKTHLPHEHLDTASSLHSFGMLRMAQGRFEDSANYLRNAFAIRSELLKREIDPQRRDEVGQLAEVSRRALVVILTFYQPGGREHDTAEALELSQESVAWSRAHLGSKHPETAIAMLIGSGCLLNKERPIEAASLIAEALPVLSQADSTKTLGAAISQFQLATISSQIPGGWGKNAALAATDRALELAKNSVDIRHPLMIIARRTALGIYLYHGEFDTAHRICEEYLSQLEGMPPSYVVCEAKGQLALVLVYKEDRESIVKAGDLIIEISATLDQIKLKPPREFEQLAVRIADELAKYDSSRAAAVWRAARFARSPNPSEPTIDLYPGAIPGLIRPAQADTASEKGKLNANKTSP